MKYYKIIQDDTFIGVVTSNNFIRYQKKHNVFVGTNEHRGEYIEYNSVLYKASWMRPSPYDTEEDKYEVAEIFEVTEEFYNQYKIAIENNETIERDYGEPPAPTPIQNQYDIIDINFIRESKINEMSYQCRKAIEEGFDLEFYGKTKHFSLTIQDQLNLISLEKMAQNQSLIPYHADGEDVIFYTPEEIDDIIDTANALKMYHTTYYNSLKKYINSLNIIEEISSIEYGIEIPEQYQTEVFKAIGGN